MVSTIIQCGIMCSKISGIENWNTLYQTIPHGNVEAKIGITSWLYHLIPWYNVFLFWKFFQNKNTLHQAIPRFLKTSEDAATPDICYVIMQKVFHILFTFLCVSTFEKVVREGKNMAFSLCLADEERCLAHHVAPSIEK